MLMQAAHNAPPSLFLSLLGGRNVNDVDVVGPPRPDQMDDDNDGARSHVSVPLSLIEGTDGGLAIAIMSHG